MANNNNNNNMFVMVFLILMMISSTTPTVSDSMNQDLVEATREMQTANYFTFVMLINMSPLDTRLEGNVTFLMPNDRMLANMVLQEGSVSGFLLRHSIPSPLAFDVLEKFPTGTTIPSSLPNCMLRVSNNGRKNYVLNNVKIISPYICVEGSSIRCHGIDGVLSEACSSTTGNYSAPILPCVNSTCKASAPPPSTVDNLDPHPTAPNIVPHKSGSPHWTPYDGSLNFVVILSLVGVYFYF
ncbi:hypothetical protein Fmac_027342 [Flemingia macrophylla]|uniref:FAS1 domain-containing protein n=1 Tax=Flemingia macrophylla TaxID=520843 RepID=A0ABD1LHE4_9FABA